MLQFIFSSLLLIHQFVYYSGIEDSFDDPKWVFISFSVLLFFLLVQWIHRRSCDLKYPGRYQVILVLGVFIPVLVDLYHGSADWPHTLGLASVIYCMPYIFRRAELSLQRPALLIFTLICISTLMEWFGLLPMIAGSRYHLSGFVGNPNLLGACLVFWYWLARDRVKYKNLLFLLCLIGSTLVLSRAAILALLITESIQRLRLGQRVLAAMIILGSLGLGCYVIYNPHNINQFSSLKIRLHEVSVSLEILEENWLTGIGQGNYRNEFFQKLEGRFKGVLDFESDADLKWIRLSSSSHQSILGFCLWIGIPLSLLLLFLVLVILRLIYQHLSSAEQLALCSVFLMAQVYDLMNFSVILIPCIFILCKGLGRALEPTPLQTSRRWMPLMGLVLWALFWSLVFVQSKNRFKANSKLDFEKLVDSYFTTGEDYHRFARWMLQHSGSVSDIPFIEGLLHKAHSLKPDPSTRYHLALLAIRSQNKPRARELLLEGIETLPTFSAYYYGLALLAEDEQEEEHYYLLSLNIDHYFYRSWKNLGVLMFERGDYVTSALSFHKAMVGFRKKKGKIKTIEDQDYFNQLNDGFIKASELKGLKGKK